MNFQQTMEIQTFTTGKTLLLGDRQQITLIEQSNGLYSLDGETFNKDSKNLFISTTNSKTGFIVKKILSEREPELPPLPDFDEDGDIINTPPPLPHLPEELKTFKIDNMVNFLKKLPTDIFKVVEKFASITVDEYIADKEVSPAYLKRDACPVGYHQGNRWMTYSVLFLDVPEKDTEELRRLRSKGGIAGFVKYDLITDRWYYNLSKKYDSECFDYEGRRRGNQNVRSGLEHIIKKWGIDTEYVLFGEDDPYTIKKK